MMHWFLKRNHLFVLLLCISAGWVVMTVSAEVEQNTRIENSDSSSELDRNFTAQETIAFSQEHLPIQPAQKQTTVPEIKSIQLFYPPLPKHAQTIQRELNAETKADFSNTPLTEVINFFQNQHGINIYLNALALEQLGLNAKEPVNVSLNGIKLKSALELILRPLGLDYVVDQEVLKITTIEEVDRTLTVRIYLVADLGSSPEEFKALENVIRNICLPLQDGQPFARSTNPSISSVPQCQALVVNDTDRVHFKITELLSQLRQVRQDQASLKFEEK